MKNIFTRSSFNPVLRPDGGPWWKLYNPGAATDDQGRVHVFPRLMKRESDWHSCIGHAVSVDGEHFEWAGDPVLVRRNRAELRGLEDPRITRIAGRYFMTFAAYDGKLATLHSAYADSLNGPWHRQGPMVPGFDFFGSGGRMVGWERGQPVEQAPPKRRFPWSRRLHWSKSGALFSERIGGRYVLVFGEFYAWLATSSDGVTYKVERQPLLQPRKGTALFDNTFLEVGPPPVLTEKGWLLLYHGIDEKFRYRLGFVLLDRQDPRHIIYRSTEPVFGPEAEYEVADAAIDVLSGGIPVLSTHSDAELKAAYQKARTENVMPQVTFCTGAVVRNGRLWIYYGAGDTSVCTAWASLEELVGLAEGPAGRSPPSASR
jgi:predicted GH43/DUF377 family glycosyl hydrolase